MPYFKIKKIEQKVWEYYVESSGEQEALTMVKENSVPEYYADLILAEENYEVGTINDTAHG